MYPVIRLNGLAIVETPARTLPLPVTGTHVSHHICLPWDIDLWMRAEQWPHADAL